jgi:iron complex transport system substrate-binding protein
VKRFLSCLLLAAVLLPGCQTDKRPPAPAPERPGKVVTMRAGALRLMLYMGLADQVAYIERNDLTRVVPYMMAFPELKQLPVIGVGNNYDPETVAASDADLIICTYMNGEEAEALSQKTGKPVVGLAYGDLYRFKADFYKSLSELGRLFHRTERADSLIAYIENTIAEVSERAQRSQHTGKSAYIGGIAFNGLQGLTSTRAQYPPFIYLGIENPADALPTSLESIGMGQKNMLIDKEQIISWDTDFLFLDAAGQPVWDKEIEQPVLAGLRAIQSRQTYVVLPFNWHTINYENLLCNMWFVGRTVYPDTFADVDVEQKCREIFTVFYGRDIFDEVKATYRPYEKR